MLKFRQVDIGGIKNQEDTILKRQLFKTGKALPNEAQKPEMEKLVEAQARLMAEEYGATCFDVKQLQKILGVGESNVYQLLKSGTLACRTIGRRKIVPAVALARFLVIGDEKST